MRKWLPLIFIAADLVFVAVVYRHLPQRMPAHWNLGGHIDRYGSRFEGAFLIPLLAIGVWALLRALPTIDPRRQNYARFADTYDIAIAAVVGSLVVIHVGILGIALGWNISIQHVVPLGLGLLSVVLGNVMPRARPNWWFGIRTPWTLSNDRVWMRTHRVAGYLMTASGLACFLAAALEPPLAVAIVVVVLIAAPLAAAVYSYFAWKEETSR